MLDIAATGTIESQPTFSAAPCAISAMKAL